MLITHDEIPAYYDWLSRPSSARAIRHAWLTNLIVEVHQRARGTYGARRVHDRSSPAAYRAQILAVCGVPTGLRGPAAVPGATGLGG